DNVDVHNLATPLRYEHSAVSSDKSNSLIAQLAHYTCQDGDPTMTSSNTSNRQELDDQDGNNLMTLLNSRQEVDGSFAVTTQAPIFVSIWHAASMVVGIFGSHAFWY
ncbi:hypothetical protein Tco_0994409, partial [Tanacetum coccineum]